MEFTLLASNNSKTGCYGKFAVNTLPSTKPLKSGRPNSKIMGWNENVRPFKEEAQYWRSLWISAGRPNNHPLFTNMKSSKAQYKYAIRRVKKSAEFAQNNAFLSQILDKKSSGNLYSEIKKFRKERKTLSSRIDDNVGNKQIANHFANKYQSLYSKCELGPNFEELKNNIEGNLSDHNYDEICAIDEDLATEALGKMKGGKNDVMFSFSSDCIINGPPLLEMHLANLFRVFLVHGQVADILLLCSFIPIVKDGWLILLQAKIIGPLLSHH